MPREVSRTVYTLRELIEGKMPGADAAKQWMTESCMDNWWNDTNQAWKEALEQIGFHDPEISFSGFWSQGDGASFTSGYVQVDKLLTFLGAPLEAKDCIEANEEGEENFLPWIAHKCELKLTGNHRYLWLASCEDLCQSVSIKVVRSSHRYSHHNTCDTDANLGDVEDRLHDLLAVLHQALNQVEDLRISLCHAIYEDLEEDYEAQTSDEALIELAEANEYEFYANGGPYCGG